MQIEGFRLYSSCRCGGTLTYKHEQIADKKNKYWIYPTKNQASIYKDNRYLGVVKLELLEQKLREYGII